VAEEKLSIIIGARDQASGVLNKIGSVARTALGVAFGQIAVKGLRAASQAVTGFVQDAMAIEGTQKTFENLVATIGSSADEVLNVTREASRGMLSDADLMAASNKLISMGIADTAEEAAQQIEAATQLGLAQGWDAMTAIDNWALMMANQSKLRLDTYGISSAEVDEIMQGLMETTSEAGMTQEELDAEIQKTTAHIADLEQQLYLARLQQSEFTDNTKLSTRERKRMQIEDLEAQYAAETARLEELNNTQAVSIAQTQTMSREEAFVTAVMQVARETMEDVGEQGDTVAASWARMQAIGKNLALTVGGELLALIGPGFTALADKVTEFAPKVKTAIETAAGTIRGFWTAMQEAYSDEGLEGVAKLILFKIAQALGSEATLKGIAKNLLNRLRVSLANQLGMGENAQWGAIGVLIGTKILQGVRSLMLSAADLLVDASQVFVEWATSPETSAKLMETAQNITSGLVNGIQSYFARDEVGDSIITQIAFTLARAAANMQHAFYSIGLSIGAGIWAGITGQEIDKEDLAKMQEQMAETFERAQTGAAALFGAPVGSEAWQAGQQLLEQGGFMTPVALGFPATPGGIAGWEQENVYDNSIEVHIDTINAPGGDVESVRRAAETGALTALQAARAQGWGQ